MTRLFRLAALSAVATFLLIVLGGLSRTQAGPGCGDWPACRGGWLPPLEPAPLLDWLHRAVSASIGILLTATAVAALMTAGASARTRRAAWTAVALVVGQSLLGAATVGLPAPTWVSTLHLGLALLLLLAALATLLAVAADRGAPAWLAAGTGGAGSDLPLRRTALIGTAVVFVLILGGAASNAAGVVVACTSWPFCPDGRPSPSAAAGSAVGFQAATLIAGLVAVAVARQATRQPVAAPVPGLAAAGVALVGGQALLAAVLAAAGRPEWIGAAYLATLTPLFVALLAVVALARPAYAAAPAASRRTTDDSRLAVPAALPSPPSLARLRRTVADYVALTKPGIMSLLLTTTVGAMLVAAGGAPPFWLVIATLLGGVLAAGGANVLNCYLDRDIDAQMARTRHRASAAGRISPRATLVFGLALSVAAVVELWLAVNPLAALLALAGNLFYVFVYTLWLKRRTPQNIVIGGAAGAVPPLVGWAAVTGDLSPLAWGLFGVIFLWTPPHFWALALLKQGEYGRAAVPMLPNVAGEATTRRQIVVYTALLAVLCAALAVVGLGPLYLAATLAINGVFLAYALRLWWVPSKRTARGMFFFSLWYLALVFAAAVADRLLTG